MPRRPGGAMQFLAVSALALSAPHQNHRECTPLRLQRFNLLPIRNLADLIFAFELHRRLSAANSCITSIAAHPGRGLTDLGRSVSPGFRIMMSLPDHCSNPLKPGLCHLLFAATNPNAKKGGYYGPDGRNEAKGYQTAAFEPVVIKDATVGRRLWDESERITDAIRSFRAFHRHL